MTIATAAVVIALATGAMDVQHYSLDLRVDPASKSLQGVVETRAKLLTVAPTELALDLSRVLTVDAVTLDGKAADFRCQDDQILIAVKKPPRSGRSLSIAVTYHGTPEGKGFTFAERNGQPAISNYGMPFTAFEIPMSETIRSVSIDPDDWILKRVSADTVFELRQYTLHPGQRDTLIDVFDDQFVEGQEADGMRIIGQTRNLDDPDRFVWLRSFADMQARKDALTRFYSGPVWKAHGRAVDDQVAAARHARSR